MPSADRVPVKSPHSKMRWHIVGCPDRQIDRLCITCCLPLPTSHHADTRREISRCQRGWFLVALTLRHHRPGHPGELVRESNRRNLGRPARQQGSEPGPMPGAINLGVADNGERSGGEKAAQIAVTLLADAAKPVLAAARVLPGHEPDPGREVSARTKGLWIRHACHQRRGQSRSNTWNLIEPFARLIGPVPGHDPPVKLQNLSLQHAQLRAECSDARKRY